MSKQVSAKELAEIVTRLLTDVQSTGELDGFETYQSFMTDIAQVVCDHCGGEIHHPADSLEDIWYVGIHGNDSLPDAFGGIWREYDKEGELFADADDALNADKLKGLPVPKETPAMPHVSPPALEHMASPDASVRYFIGKLHERNGEREYVHTLRFMTDGEPDKYLDDIASRFYHKDGGDEEDGSYSFDGGCFIVTPGVCREIDKDFYVQCAKLGAITGV